MNLFATYCKPIPSQRKRPVYEVTDSFYSCFDKPAALVEFGNSILLITTDRKIQRGAIINPTRELKRVLEARKSA